MKLIPLLLLLAFVSPRPAGPEWVKVSSSPTRHVIRLSAGQLPPKITPPPGANVSVLATGGTLCANVIDWQSPGGGLIGPNATPVLTGFFRVETYDGGSQVSLASSYLIGSGIPFHMGNTLAPGASGKKEVGGVSFGIGTGTPFTATGGPLAINVDDSWTLNVPAGITASTNGSYTLDLAVTW